MPFESEEDLPGGVRDTLPARVQGNDKEAFDSAWDEYGHDEARSHRVAWGAVQRSYHKDDDGKWVERASEGHGRG